MLLVCQIVLVSVNALIRSRLGAAASGPSSGGSTRLSVSAAAICRSIQSRLAGPDEIERVDVRVRGEPRRDLGG